MIFGLGVFCVRCFVVCFGVGFAIVLLFVLVGLCSCFCLLVVVWMDFVVCLWGFDGLLVLDFGFGLLIVCILVIWLGLFLVWSDMGDCVWLSL